MKPILDQIDQVFELTRTSEKDKRFSAYLKGQRFYYNSAVPDEDFFLYVNAGGTIQAPSPLSLKITDNPWYLMLYVNQGEAELSFSGDTCRAAAHSFLLMRPQAPVSLRTRQTPFSCCLYLMSGSCLPSYLAQLSAADASRYFHPGIPGSLFAHHMTEIGHLMEHPAHSTNFYLGKLMVDLLTECILLSDTAPVPDILLPEHVRHMKRLFDQEYDRNYSLADLEDLLNISKYRLCRDFTRHVGNSPLQYLNQVRLTAAKRLLHETDMTIHAVGDAVGIPNTTHFIRLFTRDTGITPLQYRNTHRRLTP